MREALCAIGDVARRISPDNFNLRVTSASAFERVRGSSIAEIDVAVGFGASHQMRHYGIHIRYQDARGSVYPHHGRW